MACDVILQQFKAWVSETNRYNPVTAKSSDVFFYEPLGRKHQYKEPFDTVKGLLILSHGLTSIKEFFFFR